LSRELRLEFAAWLIYELIAGSNRGIDPMKCRFAVTRLGLSLLFGMAGLMPGWAQQQGYMAPNFSQSGGLPGPQMHQASQIPTFMASPLAGGPAAAGGGQFVDAHGNSIVMPASYCQGMGPGYGGPCPDGGAGGAYGDPMAIDFGGYSEDQIGPHYFDVQFATVVLQPDAPLAGSAPFSSDGIGLAQPKFLDVSANGEDYEPGWQIGFRYDLGPLSVFEATYMGIYDFNFDERVVSTEVSANGDNQLFSIFSDYGLGTLNSAFDAASVHEVSYESDLQSTELTYRRYWVGHSSRVSGTWLLGARYIRMTEGFNFFGSSTLNGSANVNFDAQNDLVGFQMGGDGWIGLRQGFRVGCEGKAGVYNNRFQFETFQDASQQAPSALDTEGDQVAFAADGGVSAVFDILPSWSLRCGYQVFYMNELVTVGDNLNVNLLEPLATVPPLNSDGHAFYHGFNAGMEYVW
jgi:hypothetical protein